MALGARGTNVLRLVAAKARSWLLSVSHLASWSRCLCSVLPRALLLGIATVEVVTPLLAARLFLGVALAASRVPAWRAMRIDPLTALRKD